MTPNKKAFLDAIAYSELGPEILAQSDNGYDVIVGSTPGHIIRFSSYDDHPHRDIRINEHLTSTAAGRYQILGRIFDHYRETLGLSDFSPASQDAIALQLIRECRALDLIEDGNFADAITACSSRWASLPGSQYGQHTNKLSLLQQAYVDAGGMLA